MERNYYSRMTWVLFVLFLSDYAHAGQYFLRQPFNTTVRVGTTRTLLQCIVENRQTDLQWTKDGFGLGRGKFPDPRYSISTRDNQAGGFYLQIVNVKLSDDGGYQCQANPDFRRGINPLQSRTAYLNVIVPPKNIILDPAISGTISVTYPGTVAVTCSIPDTKPASVITWRVSGEDYSGQINQKISSKPGSKLVTTSSSINLRPDKIENGSTVECVVNHEAMDAPVSSIATLNVLYPPQVPVISEFDGQPIKAGDMVTMRCVATGGNPLAKITWLIDDIVIFKDYTHSKDKSESVLRHRVRPQDDGKEVTCRAENPALSEALETHVTLEVYYSPEEIILERDPVYGAPEQGTIEFTCHYPHSNPKATLQWYIGDVKLPPHWSTGLGTTPYLVHTHGADASTSRSVLTLTSVRRDDAKSKIVCKASIPEIDYEGEVSTYPTINFPPRKVDVSVFFLTSPVTVSPGLTSPPILRGLSSGGNGRLSGLDENSAFKEGDIIQLKCESRGGNPPPNLNWFYQNGQPVISGEGRVISPTAVKVYTGVSDGDGSEAGEFITISTLELTVHAEHNGMYVSCQASHAGYPETMSDNEQIKVVFPPRSLTIEQFPSTLVARKPMSLTCTTSSSNPAAKITWYHKNSKLPDHWSVDLPPSSGDNQGYITSSRLQLIPDAGDNGNDVTCTAEVEILRQTVTQPFRLRVQYPPVIYVLNGNDTFNVTDTDKSVEIKASSHANPENVTYAWYRFYSMERTLVKRPLDTSERVKWSSNNGFLQIENLRVEDDGIYQVRATNERGTTEKNITLNVFYPILINKIVGHDGILKERDTASLKCEYKSHPLTPVRVSWVKQKPGRGRLTYDVTTYSTYSILTLQNVTAHDRGSYKCIADNGIGIADSAQTNLDILYSPMFVESTPSKVAVSSVQDDGTLSPPVVLPCIVKSRPETTFTWISGNETIVPSEQNGYSILLDKLDFETYRTTLRVTRITDYDKSQSSNGTVAEFSCLSSNSEGSRERIIKIVFRGPPDTPSNLEALNVSASSIELEWMTGFDGGADQKFLVYYKRFDETSKSGRYKQLETRTNKVTLTDLESDQEYRIHVIAINAFGQSNSSEKITVTTTAALQEAQAVWAAFGLPQNYIIAIAIVGGMTILFAIAIAIFTLRKCKVTRHSYKPNTIETDCDSLEHAESSLSSCGSTRKRHDSEKQRGNAEEKERLTNDEPLTVYPGESATTPLNRDMQLQQSCYFDCTLSRCESNHTVYNNAGDVCGQNSSCSFPGFQDEIAPMPTYAQINRFHTMNQSARMQRPVMVEQAMLPRNSSEPRFNQDAILADECRQRTSPSYPCEPYEQDTLLTRPSDLPLPPSLPLYAHLPFRSAIGSSNDALNTYSQSGTEFSRDIEGYGIRGSGQYRPYRTLESGSVKSSFDRFSSDDRSENNRASHTFGRPYYNYGGSRDDIDRDTCPPLTGPSESCMYNIVSRPDVNCGYTSSLSTMSHNGPVGEGKTTVNDVMRNVPNYSQTNGNGLFVKSLDNMGDCCMPRRASIVNEDGTINRFGFDHPNESRTNILDSIRESQSQDPLPCSSASDNQDNYGSRTTNSPLNVGNRFLPNYGRRSLRETTYSPSRYSDAEKRGVTPPIRFRDELSLALSNGSRSSSQQERQSGQHQTNRNSDDDMDSGCGGSADAVVLDLDRSPLTTSGKINSESLCSDRNQCVDEVALFV